MTRQLRGNQYPYRTALVTGASSGIGVSVARLLAARRVRLCLVARRTERLEAFAHELRTDFATSVEICAADLTDAGHLARVEDRLRVGQPAVELLVNNAGMSTAGRYTDNPVDSEVHKVLLNVIAMMRLTHAALPRMLAARHGGVLTISSLMSWMPSPGNATYASTKAFITSLSRSVHDETRAAGVHVTVSEPGPVRTEFFDTSGLRLRFVPQGLWLAPEQVAEDGLAAVAAGRSVTVPDVRHRAMAAVTKRLPEPLLQVIGRRLWDAP
ncbi:SDR family oxidoreductase [Amycolatopsis sp. NPDC051071]|uniref:SDR family NAD(P)-dependent oxidoreductase n=1 Tax=Amycolatopsis sp. NPDC051071 TaxID=3154637 RepID=UPI00341FB0F2